MTDTHADTDPAVSVCFSVKIDGHDLGAFSGCDGLGCEMVVEQREEGGNNAFVWQLPTRLKYTNLKLTRPVGRDSGKLTDWLLEARGGVQGQTAVVEARNAAGDPIASWTFADVFAVRWTGPSLSVDSPKVATETLELGHHGFLPNGASR